MKKEPKSKSAKTKLTEFATKVNIYFGLFGVVIGILSTMIAYQQLNSSREQQALELEKLERNEKLERKTEEKYFVPATEGEIKKLLKSSDVADCWTSSLSTNRNDAYRCAVNNLIHDPCYVQGSHLSTNFGIDDIVSCPGNDPNDRSSMEVLKAKIKERNTYFSEEKSNFYWLIKIENGLFCRAHTGATGTFVGHGVSRACSNGKEYKGLTLDSPEEIDNKIFILFFDEASKTVKKMFVEEAWQ